MLLALSTLRVNFVDVLGTGGPRGKPATHGRHLQPADRRVVPRRTGQLSGDRFTGERGFLDRVRRELFQLRFLLRCRRRVNARVEGRAELRRQSAVMVAGILTRASGNLCGEQIHDWTVFIGGPDRGVKAKKTRARALLTGETARS